MMASLRAFWDERTEREQQLLAVMLALAAIVGLWLGIVRPLASALSEAQARLDRVSIEAGQVAGRADALRLASRVTPPALGTTLAAAVGAAAEAGGFTPSRLDPQGDDRIVLAISAVKSTALFAWLDGLARKGVFAERIAVRPNSDATVSVEATLRVRRP